MFKIQKKMIFKDSCDVCDELDFCTVSQALLLILVVSVFVVVSFLLSWDFYLFTVLFDDVFLVQASNFTFKLLYFYFMF